MNEHVNLLEQSGSEPNAITIDIKWDEDGNEDEGRYVVTLSGTPADEFAIDEEEFDRDVDAHAFAEEVSETTGIAITWGCAKPAWA
ncbi:hypothetical protein IC617_08575 [Neiella sp. HB171785]|uniref:Uncharacterized protein n=1 Tax=Neiella litorisoli TaxID=2771431 RepID=A0A8J6QH55_9GAMM|nr:hypothetical protein [Neiella litorisoli]MBD1389480.1 hypothetical protein [Neiella litorisoli]